MSSTPLSPSPSRKVNPLLAPLPGRFALVSPDGRFASLDIGSGKPYLTPSRLLAYTWPSKAEAEAHAQDFYARALGPLTAQPVA